MEKQGSACRLSQLTCTHTCQKNSLARHVLKPACPWNRLRRSESSAQRPARLRPVPWLPASLAAPGTSAPSEASCSAVRSRVWAFVVGRGLWYVSSSLGVLLFRLFPVLILVPLSVRILGTLTIYSWLSLALFWELWCEWTPHIAFINMS